MLCRKIDFIVSVKKKRSCGCVSINITDVSQYNRPNTESVQSYHTVSRLLSTASVYIIAVSLRCMVVCVKE